MKILNIISLLIATSIQLYCSSGKCAEPQSSGKKDNKVVRIDLTREIDDITVLMAASARRTSGISVKWPNHHPKHFWIEGFGNINEYLEWDVYVEKDCSFHIDALLSSAENEEFEINVLNRMTSLKFKSKLDGWDKLEVGELPLSKGMNTIRLSKLTNKSETEIKSLELIESSERNKYLQRVADFRNETTWFANSGYGLMFQYGPWSYPETGEKKKSLDELAETFDIEKFINMLKEAGASYVIWSLTWWEYKVMMPVEAIDNIVGHSKLTASENFIFELAKELKNNDIRFMLYYHVGHDLHLEEPTDWWKAQKWPEEFAATGLGNREVFFSNFIDVVTEIGESLGEYLDGWWFDDGLVFYPAPFEKLGNAARSGNPNRLVAYNSWISARYTDFQDTYFGEGERGQMKTGSSQIGGDGVFTTGPQKGLLQHSMFVMEEHWGINSPNQKINTIVSQEDVIKWVRNASERRSPISMNLLMWEDGTVSDSSLDILKALKKEFRK